jgi:hypothetical protein
MVGNIGIKKSKKWKTTGLKTIGIKHFDCLDCRK